MQGLPCDGRDREHNHEHARDADEGGRGGEDNRSSSVTDNILAFAILVTMTGVVAAGARNCARSSATIVDSNNPGFGVQLSGAADPTCALESEVFDTDAGQATSLLDLSADESDCAGERQRISAQGKESAYSAFAASASPPGSPALAPTNGPYSPKGSSTSPKRPRSSSKSKLQRGKTGSPRCGAPADPDFTEFAIPAPAAGLPPASE